MAPGHGALHYRLLHCPGDIFEFQASMLWASQHSGVRAGLEREARFPGLVSVSLLGLGLVASPSWQLPPAATSGDLKRARDRQSSGDQHSVPVTFTVGNPGPGSCAESDTKARGGGLCCGTGDSKRWAEESVSHFGGCPSCVQGDTGSSAFLGEAA